MVKNYLDFYLVINFRKVSKKIVQFGLIRWHQHFQVKICLIDFNEKKDNNLSFSVAKTIRNFAEKTNMSSDDLAHFQNVVQMIHDGRLEEIPMYAQEAASQGFASLVEKLYESGFMDD
jgi:hypothetical protein